MPAGRPSELKPESQRKICLALAAGNVREHAARSAGISKQTFYSWMAKGRKTRKGKYREFLDAVTLAEARVACNYVAIVQKAANERTETTVKKTELPNSEVKTETTTRKVFDWQAAKWWLERRFRASIAFIEMALFSHQAADQQDITAGR